MVALAQTTRDLARTGGLHARFERLFWGLLDLGDLVVLRYRLIRRGADAPCFQQRV